MSDISGYREAARVLLEWVKNVYSEVFLMTFSLLVFDVRQGFQVLGSFKPGR